jgi:alcohol dehydrogenase (NADP+)
MLTVLQTSLGDYIALLKTDGTFVQVGNPDDGPMSLPPGPLIMKRARFAGSAIGSPDEIREMFALAVDKNVKPWIEQRPMNEANQVLKNLAAGDARYRYCLVN